MREIAEIIELLRQKKVLKSETAVAKLLGVTQQALSNHKSKGSIPFERLVALCENEGLSLDWLLLGDGTARRQDVAPDLALAFASDNQMQLIYQYFSEHPEGKQVICDLIRAKMAADEALERFMKGK